jgi:hypothetical protein
VLGALGAIPIASTLQILLGEALDRRDVESSLDGSPSPPQPAPMPAGKFTR